MGRVCFQDAGDQETFSAGLSLNPDVVECRALFSSRGMEGLDQVIIQLLSCCKLGCCPWQCGACLRSRKESEQGA